VIILFPFYCHFRFCT